MYQSKSNKIKPKDHKKNQVRIIGGSMRGRKINFSDGEGLRPTLDQVRETLFNWLTTDIHDAVCLDLYAGSGAIGFEAISRGAKSVIMVDASSKVTNNLKENSQNLSIENTVIVNQKAENYLENNQLLFDLVFLDPPFEKGMLNSILNKIQSHLSENALIYVEQEKSDSTTEFGDEWEVIKSKKTSRFCYALIALKNLTTSDI